jgi:hypothetical protein
LLDGNPYNFVIYPEAPDAWKDGWLDANHARRRACFGNSRALFAKALQPAL